MTAETLVRTPLWDQVGQASIGRYVDRITVRAESTLGEFGEVLESRDKPALVELAHKLKSAALSVGAMALGGAYAQLEAVGRSGDWDGVAALVGQLPRLIAALRAQRNGLV